VLRSIGIAALTLAALAASGLAAGGTASASFGVNILLIPPGGGVAVTSTGSPAANPIGSPSGSCISASLSERNGALVRVVCASGQFVSISPSPGQRFFGTHGGAYGYYFGPAYGAIHRTAYGGAGGGTITSFRVYSIEGADGPLDLLVSF
jgi:hypothetical protein